MDHSRLSAELHGFPRIRNDTWQTDEGLEDAGASEIAKWVTRMSRGVATFIAVLFIGYLVLGLTGNFLTIMALLRCPRVRNVTAAFIISLCVADFLFCVLVLPWEVSRFLAGEWIWGEGWICTVFPLLRYWNVAVSLLSIAMITINRYIMIAHYSVYKTVYRKGWIALMIAFCWVFAFVMLLPTLLSKWGRFGFDPRLQTCSIIDDQNKSPKQVLFGLGFCVPAIIIIICYSLIFYVIHKSEKRMRQHTSGNVNGSHHGPVLQPQPRLCGKVEREVRRRRNEWRITKMVLIIFIAFLITYLPITLVKNLDKTVDYPVEGRVDGQGMWVFLGHSTVQKGFRFLRGSNSGHRERQSETLIADKDRGKGRGKVEVEEVNDKTMMSQVSFSDAGAMPECHELPEVFVDK
ncbi:G-protein coupled receptor moody [Chionoecetes opilio]|uniref:G-protein coupled receptor moody n=1 Tax=Chionoecetes opilio TaxID=41210 RepID=A0A8J8WFM0_CHIOP|nr:G-protein coupled receptor moody [Chionoecetes opilio]